MTEILYGDMQSRRRRMNNREPYKVGDIIEYFGVKAYVTKVDDRVVNYIKVNGETGRFIIDRLWLDWEVIGHTNSIVYNGEMWF